MADSSFCFRLAETELYGYGIASANAESPAAVPDIISVFRASTAELLILRLPSDWINDIHIAEHAGALLCDILVAHTLPASQWHSVSKVAEAITAQVNMPQLEVGLADLSDTNALIAIAGDAFVSGTSHWHADPRTGSAHAVELYRRWTRDLAQAAGPARPILVGRLLGRPVGFVAIEPKNDKSWRVPLAAVAPTEQRKGILTRILSAAIQYLPQIPGGLLTYETQLSNLAAIRAVSKLGFQQRTSHLTFHLWRSNL